MNFNLTDNPIAQVATVWQQLKSYQKISIITIVFIFLALFGFIMLRSTTNPYVPLFSTDRMLSNDDISQIKTHLDRMSIPYKINDNEVQVPSRNLHTALMELSSAGIPKMVKDTKGYELFDTNTWIRGEKELQILELRALKGQLERDIAQFENIRSASVILDIAPPRPFGGTLYKTKASIILNLVPGARLSPSELRAITYHISGAVRGLAPNMVAISDTTGKLYQALDPDGNTDLIRNSEVALEEHLKSKIDGMLVTVFGFDNYYSSIQVVMSRDKTTEERKTYTNQTEGGKQGSTVTTSEIESYRSSPGQDIPEKGKSDPANPLGSLVGQLRDVKQQAVPMDSVKINSSPGKIENISIAVLIDKAAALNKLDILPDSADADKKLETLRLEIQKQLDTIMKGYQVSFHSAVDFVTFDPGRFTLFPKPEEQLRVAEPNTWPWTLSLTALALGLSLLVWDILRRAFQSYNFRYLQNRRREERAGASLRERELMINAIKVHLKAKPEVLASYFETWLNQRTR